MTVLDKKLSFSQPIIKRDKPLLVLAGGFGTRLQGILKGNPKPLANINGVPFIEILFQNWLRQGFDSFILSLFFKSDLIIEHVERLKKTILSDCEVQYIIEPIPLGTGGAISYVVREIEIFDQFFVTNADTWIDNGYSEIDKENGNVIGIVEVEDTSRYGKVILDENFSINKFEEKSPNLGSGLINAGIYKFSKEIFMNWNGEPFSLESDLFPTLIHKNMLKGAILKSNFIDIGIPEDYEKFCNWKNY